MRKATTGQLIAQSLVDHRIDTIFGIPGAHMYDFNDALYALRDKLRFIHTRHEQGAGYMAYGYAKSSGRVGAYTVVPGPGVLNSGAALCTAYGANAPVLCVTGNIMSHLIGRGRGQLHELPDQLATLRGLTKAAERINHPSEASATMAGLFTRMLSGRQGPVAVETPWDVFGEVGVVGATMIGEALPAPIANPDSIAAAAALIAEAKRPLIMVGGGATEAGAEIAELARRLQAPVTAHRSGKGILSDDDPYSLNFVAAYEYWRDADLLIGIGSRLELQHLRWRWLPKGVKTIRIDIDPTEMVRLKPDVGIVADSAMGARALLDALGPLSPPSRREELRDLRAKAREATAGVQPQIAYLDAIRAVLPRDGFFVEEISQIGVKIAHPDKAVVSISGDGGFLFGAQEMATAVQHRINVVAIVFDNNSYGNVRRDQQQTYDGRLIGSDLVNPDFVKMAESFGLQAFRAASPDALRHALDQALSLDRPTLIEVPVSQGSEVSPWPFIHPAPPALG
jgi:acetolactate synthase I/II/III large subunit